jgi:drug/metabolite transporter (DMT)-like permease
MLPIGAHEISEVKLSTMNHEILLATLFVLIVPTYLPNLLLNYSLRVVSPTVSSVYSYLQPVVAIALAVAMGLDKLQVDTVIFALIIFIGVGIVVGSYRKTAN